MRKLVLLATIIALFLCSCAKDTETELTAEQKATIEKEVRDQQDQLLTALNNLDIGAFTKFWKKDEMTSAVINISFFPKSTFVDSASYWFSLRERQIIEQQELEITSLTQDMALMTNVTLWEVWMKSGEYSKSKDIATLLWKKDQDGWKILHLHESWQPIEEISSN
jgi:ketosteroid isomerase-like protein